jgi:hypothetical protein
METQVRLAVVSAEEDVVGKLLLAIASDSFPHAFALATDDGAELAAFSWLWWSPGIGIRARDHDLHASLMAAIEVRVRRLGDW